MSPCLFLLLVPIALIPLWMRDDVPPIWPKDIKLGGQYRIAVITRSNTILYYPEYRAHSWLRWRRVAGDSDPFMIYYLCFKTEGEEREWVATSQATSRTVTVTYIS